MGRNRDMVSQAGSAHQKLHRQNGSLVSINVPREHGYRGLRFCISMAQRCSAQKRTVLREWSAKPGVAASIVSRARRTFS